MRNNETGEFELVVGNRQLISAFFIVVLLFAVAFAMGYVVGQNAPRSAKLGESTTAVTPAPAAMTEAQAQPSPVAQASAPAAAPVQTADNSAQAPAGSAPAAAPPVAPAAPESLPAQTAAPAGTPANPTAAPDATAAPGEAPPGSYWQVLAVVNPATAEVVVQTLKEKGFPASMAPGPNSLMRVLVGPYSDTQSMGRAKTELEREGFQPRRPSPYAVRK